MMYDQYSKQHFHVSCLHIYARYRGGIASRQPRLHTHDGIQSLPIEMENLLSCTLSSRDVGKGLGSFDQPCE